jgi:hypothetical protein
MKTPNKHFSIYMYYMTCTVYWKKVQMWVWNSKTEMTEALKIKPEVNS